MTSSFPPRVPPAATAGRDRLAERWPIGTPEPGDTSNCGWHGFVVHRSAQARMRFRRFHRPGSRRHPGGGPVRTAWRGAILTMLADTMMPEAFEHGGSITGLVTCLGFVSAFP